MMYKNYKKTRPPYGFNFFDPMMTENFEKIVSKIQAIFKKEGYKGVIPSTIDFPETFDEYENYNTFQLRDSLGEDLYMRSDVTAQVIKGVTNLVDHDNLSRGEHKFYYIVPVFHDIRKSYPRYREVYQAGAESIGMSAEYAVPELIAIADNLLTQVFDLSYEMVVGDIRIFQYVQSFCDENISDIAESKDVPSLTEMLSARGFSHEISQDLSRLLLISPNYTEWLVQSEALIAKIKDTSLKKFLKDLVLLLDPLINMIQLLEKRGIPVRFDPLLFRKVDYYTGFVFEGYVENLSYAPLRGGVYDGLVEKYSKESLPASGFSIDISSLIIN